MVCVKVDHVLSRFALFVLWIEINNEVKKQTDVDKVVLVLGDAAAQPSQIK